MSAYTAHGALRKTVAACSTAAIMFLAAGAAAQQPLPPARGMQTADLAVSITGVRPDSAVAGQRFDIAIEVVNNSAQAVGGVTLVLEGKLLALHGLTLQGHPVSCKAGPTSGQSHPSVCTLTGTLPAHARVTLVIMTVVTGKKNDFAVAAVTVKAPVNDPVLSNNNVTRYIHIS